MKKLCRRRNVVASPLLFWHFRPQELGAAADIAAANKTDDEKLTEAGLVAALTVVTDIITDDMKHDLAGRWNQLDIGACDYFSTFLFDTGKRQLLMKRRLALLELWSPNLRKSCDILVLPCDAYLALKLSYIGHVLQSPISNMWFKPYFWCPMSADVHRISSLKYHDPLWSASIFYSADLWFWPTGVSMTASDQCLVMMIVFM